MTDDLPGEVVAEADIFKVSRDSDGDHYIADNTDLPRVAVIGDSERDAFRSALRDAGLLESESADESGSSGEEWDSAREWYEALESAADDTFGWTPQTDTAPDVGDYDAVVVAPTSANVRRGTFFEEFGDSLAYIRHTPEASEVYDNHDVEFNDRGLDDPVAFFLDAPDGVDVSDLETDPTPSPEDVADVWIEATDAYNVTAYWPADGTSVERNDGGQEWAVHPDADGFYQDGSRANGDGAWYADDVSYVSAEEVPTDE